MDGEPTHSGVLFLGAECGQKRRVGGQRVTHAGTFPTASLRTVLDRFRITRLSS